MTLYRTYRPSQFHDLIGQDTARSIMQNTVASGTPAHAYLFTGPRGTGKTSLARLFARALCCTSLVTTSGHPEPCGTCTACTAIGEGSAPDITEIDAASNRGIDDIRQLREQITFAPAWLKYRIFLIDEVHMLTGEAFNALLKTLEEPPKHALFLLATTELHKVPATVRSRCLIIPLARATESIITEKLQKIVTTEKLSVEPAALSAIAAAADGSFRDAEALLEQLTQREGTLTVSQVTETVGTIPVSACRHLISAYTAGDREAVLRCLDEYFSAPTLRYEPLYRLLLQELYTNSAHTTTEVPLLQALLEASLLERTSPIPGLPLRLAVLEALNSKKGYQPLPDIHIPSSTGSNNTSTVQNKTVISTPEPPSAVPVVTVSPVQDIPNVPEPDVRKAWATMSQQLRRDHPALSELLKITTFHVATGGTITIHVSQKFHKDKLQERKNLTLVEQTLGKILGTPWSISYELQNAVPKMPRRRQISQPNTTVNVQDARAVFSTGEV